MAVMAVARREDALSHRQLERLIRTFGKVGGKSFIAGMITIVQLNRNFRQYSCIYSLDVGAT